MICLDTSVVIWGVQGKASPGQEKMVARAQRYLRHLETEGKRVMFPAPAVSEYLAGFNGNQRGRQLALLQKVFFVPAFDAPAAAIAPDFMADKAVISGIRETHGVPRQHLKIDAQILAIAVANNAEIVVSDDPHMAPMAGSRIKVVGVPDIGEQLKLELDQ